MRNFIMNTLAVYLFLLAFAMFIGNLTRLNNREYCESVVVADYVFLGLTRLPCPVGGK
jgi:hypothetical protein